MGDAALEALQTLRRNFTKDATAHGPVPALPSSAEVEGINKYIGNAIPIRIREREAGVQEEELRGGGREQREKRERGRAEGPRLVYPPER